MLTGSTLSQVTLMILLAVILDGWIGEVRCFHPLVGFGRSAAWIERKLNHGGAKLGRGMIAWLLAVGPPALFTLALTGAIENSFFFMVFQSVVLYFCIGFRSLRDHARPISAALAVGDLAAARLLTGRIVSRDTGKASEYELAGAATESLLENGNDAVFGALFWFIVAGAPGALLFRLANTLDAMWGYRTSRFLLFGRVAARMDDVLNWLSARLTAGSYVLLAPTIDGKKQAWRCWQLQAPTWSSPNAGPVMASGAGALGIALGGCATYDGVVEHRPRLGIGSAPGHVDIDRAWRLINATVVLWVSLLIVASALSEWRAIVLFLKGAGRA